MRTKLYIVLGIMATIVVGMGIGNHAVYAAKVTKASFQDGYNAGVKDAGRDLQGLNGHGHDSSCPSGHTSVFCDGYVQGYDATWHGKQPSQSQSQSLSQSQSQGITNNNNPTIIINPPK
jgi:hypothetical protein